MPVHADSDLDELATILVADIDAVLARVVWRYLVDDQAGKLSTIECDLGVFGGGHFLLILEPGHLWCRLTPHGAGQAQGLQGAKVSEPKYHQKLCINTIAIDKIFSKNKVRRTLTWSNEIYGKIKVYYQTNRNCLICQICNEQLLSPFVGNQKNIRTLCNSTRIYKIVVIVIFVLFFTHIAELAELPPLGRA